MANLNGQFLDSLTLYKGLINIGSTVGQNVSVSLQSLTDGDGNLLPLQIATGLVGIEGGTINFTTGTNTRNVLSQTYTINNTGGTNTVRGIFLNAIETSITGTTHNLMDLQVGGVSRFRVDRLGNVFLDGNIHSFTNDITLRQSSTAGNGGGIIIQRAANLYGAPILFMQDAVDNSFNYIDFRRGASTLMRLFSGGSLAIGHTSASARLHVRSDTTNPAARFEDNSGNPLLIVNRNGRINMASLPTSSAGLSAGDLWNNGGVLNIV